MKININSGIIKIIISTILFIIALFIQCVITAPTTYKICGETYDNYKTYRP